MRIIEPHHLRERPAKAKKSKIKWLALALLLAGGGFGAWQVAQARGVSKPSAEVSNNQQPSPAPEPAPQQTRKFKTYTSEQFRNMYNTFAYPNTIEVTSPPPITGNTEADERIQEIAFKRGYKMRSAPVAPLSKTADGFPMQEKAVQPWHDLKAAAAKDGINLGLVSTFRAVDEQRLIFLQRLRATGATVEQVAAGLADKQVIEVLTTTSIPGASRHHTGYTIDLKCDGQDFNFFANTTCFQWLSHNNYENAKKFGWIPSYPPEAGLQGPEPEAWEYAWVGVEALLED